MNNYIHVNFRPQILVSTKGELVERRFIPAAFSKYVDLVIGQHVDADLWVKILVANSNNVEVEYGLSDSLYYLRRKIQRG